VAETGAGFGYKIEWLAVHLQSADWWESDEDEDNSPLPDEESVLALAGHWSVDPRRLEGADIAGLPWIAEPSGQ
jgi:hypothetical protein